MFAPRVGRAAIAINIGILATLTTAFFPASTAQARMTAPGYGMSARSFTRPGMGTGADFNFLYAQSAEIWTTVNQINDAEGELATVQRILETKYGTFETSLSRVSFELEHVRSPIRTQLTDRVYVNLGSEGVGFGRIENPVVPELEAVLVAVGTVGFGFDGYFRGPRIATRVGVLGGLGRERRVEAVSTDIIDSLPVQNGSFAFGGLELSAARLTSLGYRWSLDTELSWRPRWFRSGIPASTTSFIPDETRGGLRHRWRMTQRLRTPTRLTAHAIAGPNPLPDETLLPNVWDYVVDLAAIPELGTMLGAGVGYEAQVNRAWWFSGALGFYGGYPGGGMRLRWKGFQLSAGTWGIEATSGFRLMGQRVWTSSLGLVF